MTEATCKASALLPMYNTQGTLGDMKIGFKLTAILYYAPRQSFMQIARLLHSYTRSDSHWKRSRTGNEADIGASSGPFPADGFVKAKLANRV
ncbi:hypothetical protein ROHU_018830 [Labeo rohita]|uniref:Uncharacterized protein n=1 Tax=Labeo rohita TaxID=84645 RepID=A0A498N887_LABRO|nr:hypothetical protein ROHU_018830 [Labeo rohita]